MGLSYPGWILLRASQIQRLSRNLLSCSSEDDSVTCAHVTRPLLTIVKELGRVVENKELCLTSDCSASVRKF